MNVTSVTSAESIHNSIQQEETLVINTTKWSGIVWTDADFLRSRRKSVFQLALFLWVNKHKDAFMLSVYLTVSPNALFKQLGGGSPQRWPTVRRGAWPWTLQRFEGRIALTSRGRGPPTARDGQSIYLCQEMPSLDASRGGDKHVGALRFTSWQEVKTLTSYTRQMFTPDEPQLQCSTSICSMYSSGNVLLNVRGPTGVHVSAQAAWGISLSAKGMLNAKPSHTYKKKSPVFKHMFPRLSDLLLHNWLLSIKEINKS